MSYDLHITRAGWGIRSREYPISRAEWRAAAETWPGMALEGRRISFADAGPVPVYVLSDGGDHPTWLSGLLPNPGGFRYYSVVGSVPRKDETNYELRIGGLVDRARTYSLADLRALPQTRIVHDVQCTDGWRVAKTPFAAGAYAQGISGSRVTARYADRIRGPGVGEAQSFRVARERRTRRFTSAGITPTSRSGTGAENIAEMFDSPCYAARK